MTTVTGTAVVNQQPAAVHAGAISQYWEVSVSQSLTTGDIVLFGRIPDRARVIDGALRESGLSTISVGEFDISGTAVDVDRYIQSASASDGGLIRFFNKSEPVAAGFGHQISVSQTQVIKNRILGMRIDSSSGTTSGKYAMHVQYYMDGEVTA